MLDAETRLRGATPLPVMTSAGTGLGVRRVRSPRIGTSLGRVGALFLIASNFAFLFAPLFYLVDLSAHVPSSDSWSVALLLLTDPSRVFAIGDLFLLIGGVLLAAAVILLLRSLPRGDRRLPWDAFLWGGATGAALVVWILATMAAQSRARGGIDALAVTGGWSAAAVALLVASLTFAMFAVRVDARPVPRRLTPTPVSRRLAPLLLPPSHRGLAPLRWPLYAFINLAGTTFLAQPEGGDELALMGLVLTIVVLPLLGIVTYRDVKKSFKDWWKVARLWALPTPGPLASGETVLRPPNVAP